MPCHLASTPATLSVSDYELGDTLNSLWPQIEFAVEDLPWPVTPSIIMTLNFFDISSLPAEAAASKIEPKSSGTKITFLSSVIEKALLASYAINADYGLMFIIIIIN
jgi:hypothetical protein